MSALVRRRNVIMLLGGAAAAPILASHVARAQQPPKLLRIGILSLNPRVSVQLEAFEERLRQLGYREGENLAIEFIRVSDHPDRLEEAARELVRRRVDIFFQQNHITLQAVIAATRTTPIVVVATNFDPVELGVVKSIARPGGNVTGYYVRRPELAEKQIGLMAETLPGRTRLGVLWDDVSGESLPAAERAALALGWEVHALKLENPPYDFVTAFRNLAGRGAQSVLVLHSGLFTADRAHIAGLAMQLALPTMFTDKIYADAGGLISYGPDLAVAFRRCADYIDWIARGQRPADLPIEQPTRFDFTLNLKTARALGLEIPASVLARADEVIE